MRELDPEPCGKHSAVGSTECNDGRLVGVLGGGFEVLEEGGKIGQGLLGRQIAVVFGVRLTCNKKNTVEKNLWFIFRT